MPAPLIEGSRTNRRIARNAREFSTLLQDFAAKTDLDLSQVVRKTSLDLFRVIVTESPVDTGAYRASHSIANGQPGEKDALHPGFAPKGQKAKDKAAIKVAATTASMANTPGWTWRPGDGVISIFNNQPYAMRIEQGSSQQAPSGVYARALAIANDILRKNIESLK